MVWIESDLNFIVILSGDVEVRIFVLFSFMSMFFCFVGMYYMKVMMFVIVFYWIFFDFFW